MMTSSQRCQRHHRSGVTYPLSSPGGTTYHYTYAGASQNAVLSEQYGGTNTVQITYGRADQNGNPVIEGYRVNNGQAYVENDPVTGAANMLRTSSGIACLYVWDGIGNPVALLTDFQTTSYSYAYDPYGLPTLTRSSGGNGVGENPYLFKGGVQDRATGFVKFGGRWYDPATGRWTQQDTLDAPLDPAMPTGMPSLVKTPSTTATPGERAAARTLQAP